MTIDSKPAAHPPRSNEESQITQEEAVPSDGKDKEGEKMMEKLGVDKPGKPLVPTGREA